MNKMISQGFKRLSVLSRGRTLCRASPNALLHYYSFGRAVDSSTTRGFSSDNKLSETGETALARPIDFDIASKIEGQESQIVTIELEPGQSLRAETGCMLYMTEGMEVEANMGGGISKALSRMMTGQNLMVSDFKYTGPPGSYGKVALGPDYPAKVLRINVGENGGLICQKGAFMAGPSTVDIEMHATKSFGVGFFGGEGFILQKLTGEGDAFVKAGGTLIRKDLQPGENFFGHPTPYHLCFGSYRCCEQGVLTKAAGHQLVVCPKPLWTIKVQSGALVAFTPSIDYDITMMKGVKNMFFGEGLIMTTLTGPGTVWLQGLPFERMVESIASRIPRGGGVGLGVPLGMGGGGGGGEGGEGGGGAAEDIGAGAMDEVAGGENTSSDSSEGLFGDALKADDAVSLDNEGQSEEGATTAFDEEDRTMKESDFEWGGEDQAASEKDPDFIEDQPEGMEAGGAEGGGDEEGEGGFSVGGLFKTAWKIYNEEEE